jgi:hypothetical protein
MLQQYDLPTGGSGDYANRDGDGHNAFQERHCQTDPRNALSALRLVSTTSVGRDLIVRWESVTGVSYFLERSTDLGASPRFSLLATNLAGQPSTTSFRDTNAARLAPLFYRVGVGN